MGEAPEVEVGVGAVGGRWRAVEDRSRAVEDRSRVVEDRSSAVEDRSRAVVGQLGAVVGRSRVAEAGVVAAVDVMAAMVVVEKKLVGGEEEEGEGVEVEGTLRLRLASHREKLLLLQLGPAVVPVRMRLLLPSILT